MAGSKLTALPNQAAPALTDEMYLVRPSLGVTGSFNVLVSALRTLFFPGVAVAFPPDTSVVGNVGAGLDSLHSFSLPANSLKSNGDYLRIRYSGTIAANNNDKRLRVSADGQTIGDTTLIDLDAGSWTRDFLYIRLTATTIRATSIDAIGFLNFLNGAAGGSGVIGSINTDITVANLTNNAITLLVQAEATANDDVVQNLSIIELVQF